MDYSVESALVVVARSPDRATPPDRRSPAVRGDLRSAQVARSGDRATTATLFSRSTHSTGCITPPRSTPTNAVRYTAGCVLKTPSHGMVKKVPLGVTTRCDL